MPRYFQKNSASYAKSNATLNVDISIYENTKLLTQKILKTHDLSERSLYSQVLLNALCDNIGLTRCSVMMKDTRQRHSKKNGRLQSKTLGFYNPNIKRITIYQRTAVREKIVASKTFLRTLIHEFMHHYDTEKLKIRSLHTKGFYTRLNLILEKLL